MRWILLLFLPLLAEAYQYKLALCTMFKDEAPWVIEWLEYHRLLGVEHFYLYNNESSDNTMQLLQPYIKKGLVEVIPWGNTPDHWDPRGTNFDGYQMKAFTDCIRRTVSVAAWLAIIDMDEYIVPVHGKESFLNFLEDEIYTYHPEYRGYTGSIVLYWLIYGTSDVWEVPKGTPMIEALVMRSTYDHPWNNLPKAIHRPEAILSCSVHGVDQLKPGYCFKAMNRDDLRIHHYWTRDEKDLLKKRLGRSYDQRPQNLWAISSDEAVQYVLRMAASFNLVEDKAIFRYLPELKKNLLLKAKLSSSN